MQCFVSKEKNVATSNEYDLRFLIFETLKGIRTRIPPWTHRLQRDILKVVNGSNVGSAQD